MLPSTVFIYIFYMQKFQYLEILFEFRKSIELCEMSSNHINIRNIESTVQKSSHLPQYFIVLCCPTENIE